MVREEQHSVKLWGARSRRREEGWGWGWAGIGFRGSTHWKGTKGIQKGIQVNFCYFDKMASAPGHFSGEIFELLNLRHLRPDKSEDVQGAQWASRGFGVVENQGIVT